MYPTYYLDALFKRDGSTDAVVQFKDARRSSSVRFSEWFLSSFNKRLFITSLDQFTIPPPSWCSKHEKSKKGSLVVLLFLYIVWRYIRYKIELRFIFTNTSILKWFCIYLYKEIVCYHLVYPKTKWCQTITLY